MKTCFFTGQNMSIIHTDTYKKLSNEIHILTDTGVTDFYSGVGTDWDILCIDILLSIRMNDRSKNIRLHIILPCPIEIYAEKWSEERKDDLNRILSAADSVEIVSSSRERGCLKKRNACLAEAGEICLCYFNEERVNCETAQIVRMAKERGVRIFNHFEK